MGQVLTGTTLSTSISGYNNDGKYPCVTLTDTNSKYATSTERLLTDKGLNKGRFVPKGSVLVTCIASIGKTV